MGRKSERRERVRGDEGREKKGWRDRLTSSVVP